MVNHEHLRQTLKNICLLQPSYSSDSTDKMKKRGKLIKEDLVHDIRSFKQIITNGLKEFGNSNNFIVEGSDGMGRKAEAPWVRFASKRMSPNAREGYYFVIHFNRDGTAVFLTIQCASSILKKNGSLGGDNLKAAIFNAGFREGCLLLPQLGARAEVAFGPAGLGDLYVTATSPHGRNRRMGEKLGSGLTLEAALEEMVMVAEGVRAARMFRDRAEDMNIDVPFVKALNTLLDGHIEAEECCRRMVALS